MISKGNNVRPVIQNLAYSHSKLPMEIHMNLVQILEADSTVQPKWIQKDLVKTMVFAVLSVLTKKIYVSSITFDYVNVLKSK